MPGATVGDLFDYGEHLLKAHKRPPPAVPWIMEHFVDPITKNVVHLEPYQARILRRALDMDGEGYSRYSLVVWSQPKKSGKTAIAGAVGAYVAANVEAPNDVVCCANDQEQSSGRIFAAMLPTLERLGWNIPKSARGTYCYGPNGTSVRAITTRYEGEAGANQGVSLWSELWAYSGERLRRLWEEMTPPPTRRFRLRWVETYAGFKNESLLLYSLYQRIFTDDTEKILQPGVIRIWPDLPVYEIPDEKVLVFWDHAHRMPWQAEDYYKDQRGQLRPAAYIRLHENRWVESEEAFITYEMWNASVKADGPDEDVPAIYALDGSKNGDCFALVGCYRPKGSELIRTASVDVWLAPEGEDFNQEPVKRRIIRLYKIGRLRPPLYYDPYQLSKLARELRDAGIATQEFKQGTDRLKADTFLYRLYNEQRIVNYNHPLLRRHVMAAHAREYEGQKIRIIKPESGIPGEREMKVDAAVAQAMAAFKAYHRPSGGWAVSGI